MRLKSGISDQFVYFVALADTGTNPGVNRMPGYASKFVVKRSRNGGTWTSYTTPTVNQTDTGGDGIYELLLDEDTTLTAGNETEEYLFHVEDTGGHVRPVTRTIELFRTDTGTIAQAVWDEALTGASHNIANSSGRRLRGLQDLGVYEDGAVWVDETSGTSTGTTAYEDATVNNRSDDFDNAQTVAGTVGLNRIYVTNGNTITLTATINNFQVGYAGGNWTVALGGQDIGSCDFNDAEVSGTGTGTRPHFHNCILGTCTLPPSEFFHCGIGEGGGTLTVGSAGNYRFIDCYSDVAGASAPTIDLGAAVGATTMEFRRWSGGLTLNNVATGDVVSVDVVSGGTITVNGTGGTVVVRGMCNVVDGSSGSVSITKTSVINQNQIADAVWDEADTGHADTGTFGAHNQDGAGGGSASVDTGQIVNAVWNSLKSDHGDTGTFGEELGGATRANIVQVNSTTIQGTGDTGLGDTWRPV